MIRPFGIWLFIWWLRGPDAYFRPMNFVSYKYISGLWTFCKFGWRAVISFLILRMIIIAKDIFQHFLQCFVTPTLLTIYVLIINSILTITNTKQIGLNRWTREMNPFRLLYIYLSKVRFCNYISLTFRTSSWQTTDNFGILLNFLPQIPTDPRPFQSSTK